MNVYETQIKILLGRLEALRKKVDCRDAFINSQERVINNLRGKCRDLPKESMIQEQSKLIEILQDRIKVKEWKIQDLRKWVEVLKERVLRRNKIVEYQDDDLKAQRDQIKVLKAKVILIDETWITQNSKIERLQEENKKLTQEKNETVGWNENQKNSIVSKQIEINELRKRLFQAQVNISKQVRNLLKEIDSHLL